MWTPENADIDWFVNGRFGLFIHWGIYSAAARHEWVMNREKIHPDTYRRYFEHFDPDLYDPESWAKAAKEAGMKYFVITTKHHDGFCLWDSKLTEYKAPNTPAGRDLLRPMVDAFRAEGLRVGFYHSLIDWHHPEFPIDGVHPQRDDEAFREAAKHRDMKKYVAYLHGQVRELLTEYGEIDYMWFDFSYPQRDWGWSKGKGAADWMSEELERLVLELQPKIIMNDRLDLGRGVRTPEQRPATLADREQDGKPVLWETCQTMDGSWGYDRDNLDWKPADMLVKMLITSVSQGGNLLLNVGPNARGQFDRTSLDRLKQMGEWMQLHGRSIYGCSSSDFQPPADARYTQAGDRLYLHLFSWPFKSLWLEGLGGKVRYAQLLNDASEIRVNDEGSTLRLNLPIQRPEVLVPVVELFLES